MLWPCIKPSLDDMLKLQIHQKFKLLDTKTNMYIKFTWNFEDCLSLVAWCSKALYNSYMVACKVEIAGMVGTGLSPPTVKEVYLELKNKKLQSKWLKSETKANGNSQKL